MIRQKPQPLFQIGDNVHLRQINPVNPDPPAALLAAAAQVHNQVPAFFQKRINKESSHYTGAPQTGQ
jgi:hypothetical protein